MVAAPSWFLHSFLIFSTRLLTLFRSRPTTLANHMSDREEAWTPTQERAEDAELGPSVTNDGSDQDGSAGVNQARPYSLCTIAGNTAGGA